MAEAQRCPTCGREISARATQGLCPACLLTGALDREEEDPPCADDHRSTTPAAGGTAATEDDLTAVADGTTLPADPLRLGQAIDRRPTAGPDPAGDEGRAADGTLIRYFGDYEIRGRLGSGSMGIVYEARQISLNRPVALKMMGMGALAGHVAMRRFENEAEAVAGLDHPNIVPIYEVGEHEGSRYFTMKRVVGSGLGRMLSSYTSDPAAAAKLMVTISEAVHHAHQRGILHRDLKPSNILLDEQGRPHVSDFGLAKRIGSEEGLTISGAILGTPGYMAPEQAAGTTSLATTLSDVYGLGAILYALLTGRAPFEGSSPLETLDLVRHRPPAPPSRLNPRVPRDLAIICLKCLDKDPPRRYPSAQAMAGELRRFLAGEPIQARPASAVEKGWRWCRRRPMIAGLVAAVVLAVLVGLIGTTLGWLATLDARRKERQQAEMVERLLYDVRMNLVQEYWELGQHTLAQQVLVDQIPPYLRDDDLRGFEWSYWQRRLDWERLSLAVHEGAADGVALTPDVKRLASVGSGIGIWQDWIGPESLTLERVGIWVMSVAFSPDGKRLAAAGLNGWVKVWDATTGRETASLKGPGLWFTSLAFSPEGERLAAAGQDGTVKVWDAGSGEEILTFTGHTKEVHGLAFSPDGMQVASVGGEHTVKVWDPVTGVESLSFGGGTSDRYVNGVAYSPDGKRLAAGSWDAFGGPVKVWDARSGREIATLKGHSRAVSSLAFSPDNRRLATASPDGTVRLWDATTWLVSLTLKGQTGGIARVRFSPDGNRLVSAGGDGTVKVWDAATGLETLCLKGHVGLVRDATFSLDGKRIASGGNDGTVRVWDARPLDPRPGRGPRR